jgi:hypothetical protein
MFYIKFFIFLSGNMSTALAKQAVEILCGHWSHHTGGYEDLWILGCSAVLEANLLFRRGICFVYRWLCFNWLHDLNWFMHHVARVSINKYRNLRRPPIGAETCRGKMHTKLCTNICCVRRFLYLLTTWCYISKGRNIQRKHVSLISRN